MPMNQNLLSNIFGGSNFMKILDYLIDLEIDVSIIDIIDATNLSRKTVEKVLTTLESVHVIYVKRKIGKTKMYLLNRENPLVKKLEEINTLVIKNQEKIIIEHRNSK